MIRLTSYLILMLALICGCASTFKLHPESEELLDRKLNKAALPELKAIIEQSWVRPFLLEASRDGNVLYLLGTIHIPWEVHPDALECVRVSDAFVAEVDILAVTSVGLARSSQQGIVDLDRLISPGAFRMVRALLPEMNRQEIQGLSLEQALELSKRALSRNAPVTLGGQITENAYAQIYDVQLAQYALNQKKERFSLDDQSQSIFSETNSLYARLELEELAFQRENHRSDTMAVLASNLKSRIDLLTLEERNRLWVERLEQLSRFYSSSLVAVGAGHLYRGKYSLFNLLSEKGFSIREVRSCANPEFQGHRNEPLILVKAGG